MARFPRTLVAMGAATLLSLTALTAIVADAPPAGATTATAGTSTEFRTAFADGNVTHIDLTNDITMLGDCPAGAYVRQDVGGNLTIDGNAFTIDASGCNTRVLASNLTGAKKLTLENVIVTGGNFNANGCTGGGGGITAAGAVVLDHVSLIANSATNTNPASCDISGGGINASGPLTLINSTVANNTVSCPACTAGQFVTGGGITNFATALLVDSTVTRNHAVNAGAATGGGGGIAALGVVTLVYSTVVENEAAVGANYQGFGANLKPFGSVVALPQGGGDSCDVFGAPTSNSQGYNFDDASSCGLLATGDIQNGGDPLLGVLGPNGGPTQTRLPGPTSALIDKIPNAACGTGGAANVASDQRDFVRPAAALGICDIGAVEVQAASGTAGTFTSVAPFRILDTRSNVGLSGAFAPQQTRQIGVVNVASTPPVPATGVAAVVLNVTATAPTAPGWLTLFPAGAPLPTASNLNFSAGQTVPNLVVVKVGTGGLASINNTGGNPAAGSVHVVTDIVGYYTDASLTAADGLFTPIAPNRILDTRSNVGLTGAFAPNQHRALSVTAGATGVPLTASAVVMNVTSTAPSANGWLTVSPTGAAFPNASNLNFLAGQTVPNLVVVKVGVGDQVDITNTDVPTLPHPASGTVHVIADVVGYFDTTMSTLIPMPAQRILDTRFGTGGVTGPVAPNGAVTVNPRTATGLPPTGSYTAVVVNVTVTAGTQNGWLTVYPSNATLPTSSNLNFVAGQTIANLVQIGVGLDGTFKIANTAFPTGPPPASGTVQIIVDIVGWYR